MNLQTLRDANIERNKQWDSANVITPSFRGLELGGEAGEALNVIKKLERDRLGLCGSRDTVEHLAEELADIIICADLIGMDFGIDLGAAVVAKFNASSEKNNLSVKIKS